jgi:predicted O-linked N-acetylglucosamine transferase (SPINDLY family)
MGVPVVSLVGEAFYERLSYSILANSGVADLASTTREGYVDIAVALAGDRARRLALRQNLRAQMKAGPLGRTEDFARNFYDMVANALTETPAAKVKA